MKVFKYTISIILIVTASFSCRKIVEMPPVPVIEFTSFTVFDTIDILGNSAKGGKLKFHFQDGDGDLGLKPPNGGQTDTTNMFLTLFRKKNGVMDSTLSNDPLKPSAYRIPYMERLGLNKILEGTISVTFIYLFYYPEDTIRYDFFIQDRAMNISNTASTSEIVISVNNVYLK